MAKIICKTENVKDDLNKWLAFSICMSFARSVVWSSQCHQYFGTIPFVFDFFSGRKLQKISEVWVCQIKTRWNGRCRSTLNRQCLEKSIYCICFDQGVSLLRSHGLTICQAMQSAWGNGALWIWRTSKICHIESVLFSDIVHLEVPTDTWMHCCQNIFEKIEALRVNLQPSRKSVNCHCLVIASVICVFSLVLQIFSMFQTVWLKAREIELPSISLMFLFHVFSKYIYDFKSEII